MSASRLAQLIEMQRLTWAGALPIGYYFATAHAGIR